MIGPDSAKVLVTVVTAIGTVVWLSALSVMLRVVRERRTSSQKAVERFEAEETASTGMIVGETEVDGQPEELSVKLAGLLARDGMGPYGPVKISVRDRHEVSFESAGQSPLGFRRGQVRLAPSGSRTRLEYAIQSSSRGTVMLTLGWLSLAVGLLAMVVGPWLILTYVLPSPDPNVRSQAIQIIQVGQFLWMPFLFAHLARQPERMFRARIESLLHNLPHT